MKEKVTLAKYENWLLGLSLVYIAMKRIFVFEVSYLSNYSLKYKNKL